MLSKGLNFLQKNQVRRMTEKGYSPEDISQYIRCEVGVIRRHISYIKTGSVQSADSDKFGPLQGSPEWEKLSPGARGGLTRKRMNEKKVDQWQSQHPTT